MKKELAPIAMIKHFYSFAELMIQKIYRRPNEISPEIEACYLAGEKKKAIQRIIKELETIVKDSVDEMKKEMQKEGYNYKV